jgi:ABC-type antimicrobial peptide transport system permease subunit
VVAVALVVVVIVAAVVPLRRALAVSPNVALRTD